MVRTFWNRHAVVGYTLLGAIILLAAFVGVAFGPNSGNRELAGQAAALAIITATAVGIERFLEGCWTLIDMAWGDFWPLKQIHDAINVRVNSMNTVLEPLYTSAETAADQLFQDGKWGQDEVNNAKQELTDSKKRIQQLQELVPGSQKAQLIASAATEVIGSIQAKYPTLKNAADTAAQATKDVSDFVSSFKDNPARRLISLYIGAYLGLVVAVILGLDAFAATGVTAAATGATTTAPVPNWGVAITGLVMGLGSNPTHELIQALQSFKASQK